MDEFFKSLAPVLAANLLTVALVYSFVSYDRMQQSGKHESGGGFMHVGYVILCLVFLLYGMSLYGGLEAMC